MPRNLETSVYRIAGLSKPEVIDIGDEAVPETDYQRNQGHGILIVADVREVEPLDVDPDDDPPRHANIVGWPDAHDEQLDLAQRLADRSDLHIR